MRFPPDHAIELLRNGRRLTRKRCLQSLQHRIYWLVKKIESAPPEMKNSYLRDELKALVQVAEEFAQNSQLPLEWPPYETLLDNPAGQT